ASRRWACRIDRRLLTSRYRPIDLIEVVFCIYHPCCERTIAVPDEQEATMIHHLSIAARDPKHSAEVLAEIMGGKAVPFPPNPGSFFALQLDDHGSGVEVYPAGTELQPGGEVGGGFVRKEPRGYGSTHFALSVATDADTVQAIAQ